VLFKRHDSESSSLRQLPEGSFFVLSSSVFLGSVTTMEGEEEPIEPAKAVNDDKKEESDYNDDDYSFWQRRAVAITHRPCTYLLVSLVLSIALSAFALIVGEFKVEVEGAGWLSRGTLIANRHSQWLLQNIYRDDLLYGDLSVWEDFENNVQPGWETEEDGDFLADDDRRKLREQQTDIVSVHAMLPSFHHHRFGEKHKENKSSQQRKLPIDPSVLRSLQSQSDLACAASWYELYATTAERLWPIWEIRSTDPDLISSQVLLDLCQAEEATQQVLQDNGFCDTYCTGSANVCLPPYSLVLFARSAMGQLQSSCTELADAWETYMVPDLETCVDDFKASNGNLTAVTACPPLMRPFLLDSTYPDQPLQYTSSVFATDSYEPRVERMYDYTSDFDKGTSKIQGYYDTQNEAFGFILADESIGRDMALALASAFVTMMAILLHTRSPFLTLIGIGQITLSFPLAFFVYKFIGRMDFFPFLNFIGVFVVFALGADDVFVAVDKWKNARIDLGNDVPAAAIAARAFPDAGGAMFLTTFTTAVAFFATAICPVAPIRGFSVFCGLLIVMDYIMCVLLVFPALVIYDNARHGRNCCCSCHTCCKKSSEDDEEQVETTDKPSLIRRILTTYYNALHTVRYPLLVVCLIAFVLSAIWAAKMTLPTSSDVRILPEDNEFEMNFMLRRNLLSTVLDTRAGSTAYVVWGLTPADTGNHNDPAEFTQLVRDTTFQPSKTEAQVYLRDFCDRFFAQEFADYSDNFEACPINMFESWLEEQAASDSPDSFYSEYCGGISSLPMDESLFDPCVSSWARNTGEVQVLSRDGKVAIMYFRYEGRVRYDSPFDDLDKEWNLVDGWFADENKNNAPASANKSYFTSEDYWWYDTNGRMLGTAYVAAAIAIATASVVILLASRSVVLTIFSSFTIAYVLASVTAMLVSFGWTLGFLEAICFAILIGLSCDFVIHFSHSYVNAEGAVDRCERTKHALIQMGPSILAAGATSIAASIVMLFTIITFFVKFGAILLCTILQATLGSFVVFLVLTDCLGPADPTYLFDMIQKRCCGGSENGQGDDVVQGTNDLTNEAAKGVAEEEEQEAHA